MRFSPVLFAMLLAGCANSSGIGAYVTPYRIDVRQGNMITQEMVAQLKPGLTKDQVRFLLGTPLVTDIFHADRWDYVYRFQPGRGEAQQRRLVVIFDAGKLVRVGGDVVAREAGASGGDDARPASRLIEIVPERTAVGDEPKPAEAGENK